MQAPTRATSTAARCRWRRQPQSYHTHQAPLNNNNNIRRKKPPRRRSSSSAFSTSLSLVLLLAVCCWCGRAAAAAAPGSPLTLRVRMPDGAVKRVKATGADTIDGILGKLGMEKGDGGSGEGLSTDASAGSSTADGATSVAALGLGNGDFLYVKSDSAARAAAKAKSDALGRMKAAVVGDKTGGSKFVPFPQHARPPPPRATKRVKTWQDIEAMQAQTFSLKPQKDSNVKKISVEQSAMDDFVGYLKQTGLRKHRCALLFGRVSPSTNGVKREHFMAAADVATAAALQLMSMADKGKEEGVLVATVTVPVNATTGEMATEAFSVSNQTVQMFSEGVLGHHQPEPTAGRVATTAAVKEGSKETTTPETLGLICNVAIVQHEGVLQTRFPSANRSKAASLSDLKECLFGKIGSKAAAKNQKKQKQPSFLKRLSDFQLLLFLSRQMGFSRDFEELCSVVQKRDGKSPALDKLKVVLENLCDA
ncbi:conserved unknown protein [Ectocarpus siliculosus]|uniref:Nuclear pore localisation protein NPL4 C-terminal domain-containing protein n=1 Tax=Ectocarpus siliculosus TaxID=2880 RepID=D8LMW6_ECTSI|nr:conserved unknown protein [Ectocarpus siliculosus]|eukprot:CBN74767.1 conserved unknown protein [Ectocarpus siliculosus]